MREFWAPYHTFFMLGSERFTPKRFKTFPQFTRIVATIENEQQLMVA